MKLDDAWKNKQLNILNLIAMGGTGKTALMQTWLDTMAIDNFRGADAVYTWSFYSQGSSEDKQASADEFFDRALEWFGYEDEPLSTSREKGLKLAELINKQSTLLILDGLEPLQYPEAGGMEGTLRDEGLKTLFLQLALQNKGLLLISSRQEVKELIEKPETLVIQHKLQPLSIESGTELFKAFKIKGSDKEFAIAVTEVNGHALSLNLLAKYLSTYENSDIKQRTNLPALTDFPEETRDTKHAFKIMAAYEKQLQGTTELQILYMMGLFDRPVSVGAIKVLRETVIEHISDKEIGNRIFKASIQRLREQNLLNKENFEHSDILDAHPLVREYFAKRLEQQYPIAYQKAHTVLYEYYKAVPNKEQPDTLNEMEPLFAAITHGCAAGLHQQALDEVYYSRIQRGGMNNYLCKKLGAFSTDLSTLSHFFEKSTSFSWQAPAAGLTDAAKAVILNWVAFRLRALGRLQEAVQPMQAGLKMRIEQKNWKEAATDANNLSELQLIRGVVSHDSSSKDNLNALKVAEQSVQWADESSDSFQRVNRRTTLADIQHQAGDIATSRGTFSEAEKMQQEIQPTYPKLYSVQGFRYCDLLLTVGEWWEVQQRARQTLEWVEAQGTLLLDIALDKLSLGRASLQQAIAKINEDDPSRNDSDSHTSASEPMTMSLEDTVLTPPLEQTKEAFEETMQTAKEWLNQALNGLRKAGQEYYLPKGLLACASYHRWCLVLDGTSGSIDAALEDLKEVCDISIRGGMRLFLCDYHLESARLALTIEKPVLELTASEHVQKARELIETTGYKRRLPEVEYLEKMLQL